MITFQQIELAAEHRRDLMRFAAQKQLAKGISSQPTQPIEWHRVLNWLGHQCIMLGNSLQRWSQLPPAYHEPLFSRELPGARERKPAQGLPTNAITEFQQNRRLHQVLQSSYIIFSRRHQAWADDGFDWHFLSRHKATLLAGLRESESNDAATALATQWVNQHRWSAANRATTVELVKELVHDFLYILKTELTAYGLIDEQVVTNDDTCEQTYDPTIDSHSLLCYGGFPIQPMLTKS